METSFNLPPDNKTVTCAGIDENIVEVRYEVAQNLLVAVIVVKTPAVIGKKVAG